MEGYYRLITDAWRFFRKYAGQIPMPDVAWGREVAEAILFVEDHHDQGRLARKLIAVIEDELEQLDREAKREQKRGSGTP